MIHEYLNALKTQQKMTLQEVSNLSGVSPQTVKNIFSGDTENPGILALSAIVYALGGSLDAMMEHQPQQPTEPPAVEVLQEEYERRIDCIKAEHRERIKELNDTMSEQRAESAHREEALTRSGDRKVYFVIAATALLMVAQGVIDVFLFSAL